MAINTDLNHYRNGQIMEKMVYNIIFPFSRSRAQYFKINVVTFKTENAELTQKLAIWF